MKKIINDNLKIIISIFITIIIVGTGTVYAVTYLASDIKYKNTNVEDALNDLYNKKNNSLNLSYVKDGLVFDLNYKLTGTLRSKSISKDENGYIFNGNSAIYLDRMQTPQMTYEIYYKSNSITSRKTILSSTQSGGCAIHLDSNTTILGGCKIGDSYRDLYAKNIEFEKWNHVVLSAGLDGMKLYVNGKLIDSNEFVTIIPNQDSTITTIGCEAGFSTCDSYGEAYFNGYIKYARVYNRGLTEKEVLQNYNSVLND